MLVDQVQYFFSSSSDGTGSKKFGPSRVNFLLLRLGQPYLVWFPQKIANFSIFFLSGQIKSLQVRSKSTWVKDWSASHLLRIKSALGLGWVMAHLYLAVKARTLILEGLKVSFYLAGFCTFLIIFLRRGRKGWRLRLYHLPLNP